jgi:hypothetical protein
MSQQAMRVDGRVPDIFDPIQCRRKGIDGTDTYIQALIEDQAKGIKVTVDAAGERRGSVSIDVRDGIDGAFIHRHFTHFKLIL